MTREPFRRLLAGPAPAPDRLFFFSLWFDGHNNPRYAELLPRLRRLDRYLLRVHEGPRRRPIEYRLHRATRRVRDPLVFALARRRYRSGFTADLAHVPRLPQVVADVDDPRFSPQEVALLNHPALAAFVVTAERAGQRFEALGVEAPWHVVPQGVSLSSVTPETIDAVRRRHRRDGEIAVGYMAAWLLLGEDRGGASPLYNVDHLLELWEEVHARIPVARLWLVGSPSERVLERCRRRGDIVLLGRLPRAEALATVANFDVALYPRTRDEGVQAAKVAEYMGLGVPTVSYDYEVTEDLRATGAGLLVDTPRAFVDAVVRLATDEASRRAVAEAARLAGAERDWDVLARRYESEVLDRYLR